MDPATTNLVSRRAANGPARSFPDFAGLWIDRTTMDPGVTFDGPVQLDPTKMVLNVRVTGDTAVAENRLRQVWGGALCVSLGLHTMAELETIKDEIDTDLTVTGLLAYSYIVDSTGVVYVTVLVDSGLQSELDDRYGPGTVDVTAVLQPVD